MKASNVSKWCIPYLSLLSMLTDSKENFTAQMHEMRFLLRIGFLEICSSLFQATIITSLLKKLQGISQKAYFLLQKGKDVSTLSIQFQNQILIYFIALQAAAIFDFITRDYRNYYFSKMAEKLPYLTESATTNETFNTKLASNAVTSDRKTKELPDTIKWYYLVFQGFIMGPIEIITYLCTLGPTLFASILLLSLVAAYIQNIITTRGQNLRNMQSNAQADANNSNHENHAERIRISSKIERQIKSNKTFGDYTDIVIRSLFLSLTILICAYFVFNGAYDLAMMSAQASTAPAALARITKYLSLLESHANLKSSIEDRLDAETIRIFTTGNINPVHAINEVEAHKTFMALSDFSTSTPTPKEILALIARTKSDLSIDESSLFATNALKSLKDEIENGKTTYISKDEIFLRRIASYNNSLNVPGNPDRLLEGTAIEDFIEQQKTLKESFYQPYSKMINTPYLSLYISLPLILLGFIFIPLPALSAITALLPTASMYKITIIAFSGYIALSRVLLDIDVEMIDSTLLTYCISAAITLAGAYFGFQLYSIATHAFLFNTIDIFYGIITINNARIIIAILAATYPALIALDKYFLQSLMFASDAFGIWVSQEILTLINLPNHVYKKASTFALAKHSKGKASYWYPSFLPQLEFLGKNFEARL